MELGSIASRFSVLYNLFKLESYRSVLKIIKGQHAQSEQRTTSALKASQTSRTGGTIYCQLVLMPNLFSTILRACSLDSIVLRMTSSPFRVFHEHPCRENTLVRNLGIKNNGYASSRAAQPESG